MKFFYINNHGRIFIDNLKIDEKIIQNIFNRQIMKNFSWEAEILVGSGDYFGL